MSIAALGMAVAYLSIVLAGAVGALLVLIWLFQETPGATDKTGHEITGNSRNVDLSGMTRTYSAPASPERTENKAA